MVENVDYLASLSCGMPVLSPVRYSTQTAPQHRTEVIPIPKSNLISLGLSPQPQPCS